MDLWGIGMFVVFLYGRPATGKYTIGKLVAKKLDIPLFHNHLTVDLVGSLFEFGTPEFVEMREKIWLDAFKVASQSGQSLVFTFNPENTVEQNTIDEMRFAIEGSGGRLIFVELTCDESEIEDRLGEESRGGFGKLTDIGLYRKLSAERVFDSPVMPEPLLSVDTSSVNASESAELIVEAVKEAVRQGLHS
ncbi:MAG: AAA family ATPase [Acidobacteriota bacterium]|nr:AAA family ATPase [Acidobacteriota bacterium]